MNEKEWQLELVVKEKESAMLVVKQKELQSQVSRLQANAQIEQAQLNLLRLESAVNIRGAMGKEEKGYVIIEI